LQVFVTSPWLPVEWIEAHGLEPRGAWSATDDQTGAVPEGVCAFALAMSDLARAQPEAAVIFSTACDQMRRAADATVSSQPMQIDNPAPVRASVRSASCPQLAARGTGEPLRIETIRAPTAGSIDASDRPARVFLFNLPATWQTPAARRLYHVEVARLGTFLERLGGRAPADAELAGVIRSYESRRAALRELMARSPARQGTSAVMAYFDDVALPSRALSTRSRASAECHHSPQSGKAPPRRDAATGSVPVALMGGPLLPSQWPLFDAIESAGGRVVLNASEPGERNLLPPMPNLTPNQNLLPALADHYFDHCLDVFQRPNSRLYEWLSARLTQRGVRGIVLWVHVGCDLWRAEAASLRDAFGLPLLVLESRDVRAGTLREQNRLAAFIESLQ